MAKSSVQPVYRSIVKKSEKQGKDYFDILICTHAVKANKSVRENTYRRFRSCSECTKKVQQVAAELQAQQAQQVAA